MQIGQEERTAEFQVLHPFFLAPHDEILEKPFVIDLWTIINYKTKQLILSKTLKTPEHINLEPKQLSDKLKSTELENHVTKPRTETLLKMSVSIYQEEKTVWITVHIITESIMCSNTINEIRKNHILAVVINSIEHSIIVTPQQII